MKEGTLDKTRPYVSFLHICGDGAGEASFIRDHLKAYARMRNLSKHVAFEIGWTNGGFHMAVYPAGAQKAALVEFEPEYDIKENRAFVYLDTLYNAILLMTP